jgi:hypothetical protein
MVLKLFVFVHAVYFKLSVYIIMYGIKFCDPPLCQYLNCLMVCCSALLEGILHVSLLRWHTICVICLDLS